MNRITGKTTTIEEWIEQLRLSPELMEQVTSWRTIPVRDAQYADMPKDLHPKIRKSLADKGIIQLYTHQHDAFVQATSGHHVVTVTPTASGKTLCYNLPVLQSILEDDSARALYLFPTKALAQDQVAELQEFVNRMDVDIKTHTYDGDTPPTVRQSIRNAGHV